MFILFNNHIVIDSAEQMDPKTEKDLNKATALFYQQRLREAYVIFKRYFDRLPFKPERGHLKYIGMFVRTLFELGKSRELEFYRATLEKIYAETKSPEIGYQLAYINLDDQNQNLKAAKIILEAIINDPKISEFKNKARMLLAHCYDVLYSDTAAVRKFIYSIEGDLEEQNANLLITWKAKVLRDEGHFEQSKKMLLEFLKKVPVEKDWYSHVTGKITLAYTLFKMGDFQAAQTEIKEVRELTKGMPARSVEVRLQYVEKAIEKVQVAPTIILKEAHGEHVLSFNGKTHVLEKHKKTEAVLLKLLQNGFVSKDLVAQLLTKGPKEKAPDANQVYSGIHSVRRLLEKVGIAKNAISSGEGGYRFLPKIEIVKGEA